MRTFLLALYSKTDLDLSFLNFTEGTVHFTYELLKSYEKEYDSLWTYQVQVRVVSNHPLMPLNMELQVSINEAIEDEDVNLVQLDLKNLKEDLKSMIVLNMIEQDFDFDSENFSSILKDENPILIESTRFGFKTEKFLKSHIVFYRESNIKVFDLCLCEKSDLNAHILDKEVNDNCFFIFKEFERATNEVQNWIVDYVIDCNKKVSPKIILITKDSAVMDQAFVKRMKIVNLNFLNQYSPVLGGKL